MYVYEKERKNMQVQKEKGKLNGKCQYRRVPLFPILSGVIKTTN
jgi:hypothetical protein